jgi:hypothetical protein
MAIFFLAFATPNPDNKIKQWADITGNVVQIDAQEGCVTNVFEDDSILNIIKDRVDYSRYYNLVAIRGLGDYYVLYYHNGNLKDSNNNPFGFEKGDVVCYDLDEVPEWVEV